MSKTINHIFGRYAALSAALFLCAAAAGAREPIHWHALTDFPNIKAGEVPYYKDKWQKALAIDAAKQKYRDKFARAQRTFAGASGTYDVTIVTLAEKDGECTYRLLVNGEEKGSFQNPRVKKEFEGQWHKWKGIALKKGDTIAIESNTHSNKIIPEGGGFAWARGRWRRLKLAPAEAAAGADEPKQETDEPAAEQQAKPSRAAPDDSTVAGTAKAGIERLDISKYFNMDNVGTRKEIAYATKQKQTLHAALGDHKLTYYGENMPADGVFDEGTFQIGLGLDRPYDTEDGTARNPQVVFRRPKYTKDGKASVTIELQPEQQQPYRDINFLFLGRRASGSASTAFTASVEAKYVGDATWHTLWTDTKPATRNNNVAGGSFGSGGVRGQGGFNNASDNDDTWALAGTVNGWVFYSGSPAVPKVREEKRFLWKFANPLASDATKALESIRFTVASDSKREHNILHLFAATATKP